MATRSLFGGSSNRASRRSRLKEKRKNDKTELRIKGETNTISGKIELARSTVERLLGYLKNDVICIRTEEEFNKYIDNCVRDIEVGLDTETDSLDWMEGKIAGLCLYSESQKGCYIPINHISYMTGQPIKDQLSKDVVAEGLKRLVESKCKFITHNGVFDKHVCYWQLGVDFPVYWDTLIGGCLLNENEQHGLKYLWDKYCKPVSAEEESQPIATFNTLFDKVSFVNIPLDIAPLYAATDPVKTFELYKFQKKVMERPNMSKVYKIFREVEIPMLEVVNDMENTGVVLDIDYCNMLRVKYQKQLDEITEAINEEVAKYQDIIDDYKKCHRSKLENPINFGSPTQLAELFYDILKWDNGNKKNPRGTGKDELKVLANEHKLAELLREFRKVDKLMTAFLITLPEQVKKTTGKIHAHYNTLGAKTGRQSCSNPNTQQIPSHNTEIRKMFTVPEGYCMFGADFSGQEVRLMADMCGDENMIKSYMEGKDLYSTIASLAFDKTYEECCEFATDGSKNPPEYKERRSQAKSIVLGINYGRGIASIAEQINKTPQEAQEVQDKVFKSFPGIAKFIEDSQEFARQYGYVEDRWGRKRRLPDMQLPKYDVIVEDVTKLPTYDPLTEWDMLDDLQYVDDETWYYFIDKLSSCKWWSQKKKVYDEARAMGYEIIDNTRVIADAERQCVNARIQGSAATQTKIAQVKLFNNKEFRELGGRMILQVHDELICMCPIPNIKRCSEILSSTMSNAIPDCKIPFPTDVEISVRWYGKSYDADDIIELYKNGKLDTRENLY